MGLAQESPPRVAPDRGPLKGCRPAINILAGVTCVPPVQQNVLLQVVIRKQALEISSKTPDTSTSASHHQQLFRATLQSFSARKAASQNARAWSGMSRECKRGVETQYVRGLDSVQNLLQVFCNFGRENPLGTQPGFRVWRLRGVYTGSTHCLKRIGLLSRMYRHCKLLP